MPTGSTGEWPSGKAPDSGSGDRRFESFLASQHSEHETAPEAIRGPSRSKITGRVGWVEIELGEDAQDADRLITPDERYRIAMARQ